MIYVMLVEQPKKEINHSLIIFHSSHCPPQNLEGIFTGTNFHKFWTILVLEKNSIMIPWKLPLKEDKNLSLITPFKYMFDCDQQIAP